jgi:nuclear pore complex protein Nup54
MEPRSKHDASYVFLISYVHHMLSQMVGEKPVAAQMETLIGKWNPQSPSCAFQHYFYNQVTEEQAPYFAPGPNEDEKKWEEALKDKPTPGSIPVLARGPLEVGKRLEVQALCLRGIQLKLHELNDVLTKRLQAHDLQYSVRAAEARRKHIVLSRRTLALATKVQVLRNKGYTLDTNEEQLKAKINGLWDEAFDPVFSGRQEEIWARLSVLRERAGQLQKEAEDLSKQIDSSKDSSLDPEQMKKVEKVSLYRINLARSDC